MTEQYERDAAAARARGWAVSGTSNPPPGAPMTDQPTEGWLTQSPLYERSGIPAVSVVESDRRVAEAVKAERDRCAAEIARLRWALSEAAVSAHQSGQLFSKGHLHAGPYETCRAISCEDYREILAAGIESGEPA